MAPPRHAWVIPLLASLALAIGATLVPGILPDAASAATIEPQPTPLAVLSTQAPPPCPAAGEISGLPDAAGMTRFFKERARLRGRRNRELTAVLSTFGFQALTSSSTQYVVAVCDPDALAQRRLLTSFTGTAAAVPGADYVGFGFRARGSSEWLGAPQGTMSIGDRYVLPPVGARAVVDLVAATATGASSVRLGPFPAAPVAVSLVGTLQAPVAVAELVGGASTRVAVPVAAAARTQVRATVIPQPPPERAVTVVHHRIRFRIHTTPGSWASLAPASTAKTYDGNDLPGFGEHGSPELVDAKGRLDLILTDPSESERTWLLGVANPARRTALAMRCKLRWNRYEPRSVSCAPTPAVPADGTAVPPRATGARARAARAIASSAAPASAPAATLAPIAATTVARLDGFSGAAGLQVGASGLLFGDITGDGRPDFSTPSVEQSSSLLLSTGSGWQATKIDSTDAYTSLTAMPDLTGDGIGDLFEVGDQFYGGHPEWSAAPPTSVTLRSDRPFGPNDFGEGGGGDYSDASIGQTPVALPDSTGDGRPELGLFDNALLTVVASDQLPLGRRTLVPDVRTDVPADLYRAFKAFARDPEAAENGGQPFDAPVSVRGRAFLPVYSAATGGRRPSVTLTLRPLVFGADPHFGPATAPVTVAGDSVEVRDADQSTGEVLLVTTGEACTKRKACVARVRRLAPDGRVEAVASVRTTSTAELQASFIDDGPDPDALPEVVIHANEAASDTAGASDPFSGPAYGGTMALWNSSAGSVAMPSLPVLAAGGAAILADGPLGTWTAPTGERSLAAFIRAGGSPTPGSRVGAFDLTLLERLVG